MLHLQHKISSYLFTFLLIFGYVNAVPFYTENFDEDAEFVPLEQQQRGRTESPHEERPFDIDVITTDVGGPKRPLGPGGFFFQQSFPFFGPDFFNSFGGFGIGAGPAQEPWWKGPNVCTDKEEDEKTIEPKDAEGAGDNVGETSELVPGISETIDAKPQIFSQFQFSVNSCVEKPNKYVCSRIVNQNGKKKTITITRQCCHGYGRPRNADFTTPCEKVEIKSIEDTASDMGTKDFVAGAKSSGSGEMLNRKNQTLFAPLDKAFERFNDQLQSENNVVEGRNDPDLYARHIVSGEISLDDVSNEQLLQTQQADQKIRINKYQLPLSLSREPFRYTANCVPIEKHDKLTEQGLVHTLNGVLKPTKKSVMDIIRGRADLSIMRTVLEKTKLSELLENPEKPVTIFVPTDDAFDKLEPHLKRALKEGKGCASNILKNHMLDLTFCSVASIAGAKTTAYNLLGEAMRFNRTKVAAEVADLVGDKDQPQQPEQKEKSDDSEQPVIINGIAKIVEADIMGTNGVLHVIDKILPTESALPLSTLMQEKNVTIFKSLLEAAGLDNQFDDMDNITLFAPTDKAMQGTKWAQILTESPEQLRNNAELKEFLQYHVAKPMIKTCDLKEQTLNTLAGSNVRVNLYSTHTLFSNVMNRATVNCARLVHFDDESCGSVLHQVDKVLTPAKMNLLESLDANPNYSKFRDLVRSANLTHVLTNLDEGYTLLVPKNDVFEEFDDALPKDPTELENLVKTHIVNDVVCCAGIIPTNWPFVRSIESLNGAHLRITRERRPKVENAGITKCDTIAVNGIIHEINDVIVPPRRQFRTPTPQQPEHPLHHDFFF